MVVLKGTHQDITERRRVEEDYRTLFREMLDGFALHKIISDPEGYPVDYRFLVINPAFERMTGLYPRIRRLFMSGYTSDVIAHQGVLEEGVHFIQKPFTTQELAAEVRRALDNEE